MLSILLEFVAPIVLEGDGPCLLLVLVLCLVAGDAIMLFLDELLYLTAMPLVLLDLLLLLIID